MLMRRGIAICALAVLCGTATAQDFVAEGTIQLDVNDNALIDFYSFNVPATSLVTLLTEASGVGYDAGNGPSGLDSFLVLATDTGGPRMEADVLTTNDDGGPGFDSLISAFMLTPGNYFVGVANCCITPDEYVSGVNSSITGVGLPADYRLTVSGIVPEPSSVMILCAAAGVFGLGRRRQ